MDELIISIFYEADSFCKEFNNYLKNNSLWVNENINPPAKLGRME